MRLSTVLLLAVVSLGCRRLFKIEFRRANSITTSSADETQQNQSGTEIRLSNQTEVDSEAIPEEEQLTHCVFGVRYLPG